MRIHHVALWTKNLEKMKNFYVAYFQCQANDLYHNKDTGFQSYFLSFQDGAKLEIMQMPAINEDKNHPVHQFIGQAHFAVSLGSKEAVDALTGRFKADGYIIASPARTTGDGFYESCVLDPDFNRIELTI